MNILIVHNCYGAPSGEEAVVNYQINALSEQEDCKVDTYIIGDSHTPSSLFSMISAFFSGIYNIKSGCNFKKKLNEFKPDIVHFHNLYPWISHAPVILCKKFKIPYVITAHNYRSLCPSATLFNKDKLFLSGIEGKPFNIVRENIFNNFTKSFGYYLRFKVYKCLNIDKDAAAIFCVSNFVKDMFEKYSPKVKTHLVYNPYIGLDIDKKEKNESDNKSQVSSVGYLGRVSQEKGAYILSGAARNLPNMNFWVAGKISDDVKLENFSENVHFIGHISKGNLISFFHKIDILVVPSLWYETFGLIVLEAIAHNVPVIVSNNGALPELASLFKGCSIYDGTVRGLTSTLLDFDGIIFNSESLENSNKLINTFGKKVFVDRLIYLYKQIVNSC